MMTEEELDGMRTLLSVCPGSVDVTEAGKMLLAHIDEQAGQITTLKSICIQERNRYLVDFIHEYDAIHDCEEEAMKQLTREYPEIFAEEMK
jgi:hypothetical protein